MKTVKLVVLMLAAFLLGSVFERVRSDQAPVDEPPVAPPQQPHVNRFEKYRQSAAPVAIAGDDQLARINAEARRKQQVREDAKVQAKALADELERR